MLKFRPSKNRRTSVAFNEQQLTALIEKGLSDNCLRGFLYKRSSTNSKWRMKWFLLFENLLFYFDVSPQEQVQYAAAQIVAAASSSGRSHSHSLLANHQSIHSSLSSSSAGRVATTALSALIRRGQDKTDSNSHASGSRTPLRRASKQAQAAIASAQEEQWREALEAAALEPADEFGAEPVGEMASHSTETGGADGQVRLHQRSWLGHQRRASAGGQLHATSATRHTQTGSQRASSGCSGNANVDSRATPLRVPRARLQSDPQTRQETSTLPDVCRPANYLGGHIGPSSQLGSCIGGNKLGASCASAAIAAAAAANSINNQNAIGVAMCSSSSRASSRTLNSSSISGVSGHFLTHNEQTIGRTTTTTAGKAPVSYSSLLNRKIGVIFLEGSYCERLVDAVVDFEAAQDLDDSSSSLVVAAANRLASLQQLNAAAATTTDNIYDNCYGPPAQAAMATDQFAAAASGRGNPNSSSSILNTTTNNSATVAASNTYDPNQTACQQQQSITTTVTTTMANLLAMSKSADDNLELYTTFTLKWRKEGSKEYQFRTETEAECQTWVHAISSARYSTLLNDKEQLEQKYLHLSQIVESESTAKWQYSHQCEELSAEIEKLRQEICLLKRQESRSNQLRLVLNKSAAIVETVLKQQRKQRHQHPATSLSACNSPARVPLKSGQLNPRANSTANNSVVGGDTSTSTNINIVNSKTDKNNVNTQSLCSASSSTTNLNCVSGQTSSGQQQNDDYGSSANLDKNDSKWITGREEKQSDIELAIERLNTMKTLPPATSNPSTSPYERPASCDPTTLRASTTAAAATATPTSSSQLPASTSGSSPSNSSSNLKLPVKLLQRTRSMEQEQAEQELAVRRALRYNVAKCTRLASLDERGFRSNQTMPGFGLSSGRRGSTGKQMSSAALAKSLVRAASNVLCDRVDKSAAITASHHQQQHHHHNRNQHHRSSSSIISGGTGGSNRLGAHGRQKSIATSSMSLMDGDEDLIVSVAKKSQGGRQRNVARRISLGNDNYTNISTNSVNSNDNNSTARLAIVASELADYELSGKGDSGCGGAKKSSAAIRTKLGDNGEVVGVETVEEGIEDEEEEEEEEDIITSRLRQVADELEPEQEELSVELKSMVEALNNGVLLSDYLFEMENSEELRKIKKVQGFFRGWLCRRRWKQIVQEYIKSPHAESMRKRNNLVFRMVECEEEYVEQLNMLISTFLRPIKMAASSSRPPISHDELNSIFLNSETLLFLHQIFLKGLTARMESWPTLVLGDLFNMLLPMLTIYQEYVRNHHFSLQVLAECKQREQFGQILRRLEDRPNMNGRTLETFLTYPMHQIPRYIICLHEILAHTPHNHVERKSLYEAQTKLEELSRQMHDEVSETENIRQNLAIERMIIGGCDILLDVNQVFVRQGILLQVVEIPAKGKKTARQRLASLATGGQSGQKQASHYLEHNQMIRTGSSALIGGGTSGSGGAGSDGNGRHGEVRELVRQCFLFTNHLLLCTRTREGKLHLLENIGRISIADLTLIENPAEFFQQQEDILATFDFIRVPAEQQQKQEQQQQHERASGEGDGGCGPPVDGQSDGDHVEYANADLKRASTASMPSKWNSNIGTPIAARFQGTPAKPAPVVNAQISSHQQQQTCKSPANSKRTSFAGTATQVDDSGELTNCQTLPASPKSSTSSSWSMVDNNISCNATGADREPMNSTTNCSGSGSCSTQQPTRPSLPVGQVFASPPSSSPPATKAAAPAPVPAATFAPTQTPSQAQQPAGGKQAKVAGVGVSLNPLRSSLRGSRITGYLANKLSNLTNLGSLTSSSAFSSGSNSNSNSNAHSSSQEKKEQHREAKAQREKDKVEQSNQQQTTSQRKGNQRRQHQHQPAALTGCQFDTLSSSAPSSPLKRQPPPAPLLSGAGGGKDLTGGSSYAQKRPSRSSATGSISDYWGYNSPFGQMTKDYGGCDFILLLERKSSSAISGEKSTIDMSIAAAATADTSGDGGAGGGSAGAGGTSGSGLRSERMQSKCKKDCSASSGVNATFFSNGMLIIHMVAPSPSEKNAWMSDISQCIDNVHFNDLFHGTVDSSSVTVNQSVRTDPRLFKDDVDIKFSRALNSCKLPQIRYASISRLFERLTDLRFLSIDFLNTFLLTYRVFTTAEDVLEALKGVHYNSDRYYQNSDQLDPSKLVHSSFCQYAGKASSTSSLNAGSSGAIAAAATATAATSSSTTTSSQQPEQPTETTATTENQTPRPPVVPRPSLQPQPQPQQQTPSESLAAMSNSESNSATLTNHPSSQNVSQFSYQQQQQQQTTTTTKSPIPPQQLPPKPAKPMVPPRSPGADMSGANFLMAPNACYANNQKRRSTISALTPITGSNSSSLVNLAVQQQQQQLQQQVGGGSKSGRASVSGANSPCQTPLKSADSNISNISNRSQGSVFAELTDNRVRSASTSSSQRPAAATAAAAASLANGRVKQPTTTGNSTNLAVPGPRQTRAVSVSLTPRDTSLLSSQFLGTQTNQKLAAAPALVGEGQHWRLSYKRAQIQEQQQHKQQVVSAVAAEEVRDLGLDNHLRPTVTSGPRRASAAAEICVTLQVTPVASPIPLTASTGTLNAIGASEDAISVRSFNPTAPPSTPIEPIMGDEVEPSHHLGSMDGNLLTVRRVSGKSKRDKSSGDKAAKRLAKQSARQQAKENARELRSKFGANSSESEDDDPTSISSSDEGDDESNVNSSQSENGLIQSSSGTEAEAIGIFVGSSAGQQQQLQQNHVTFQKQTRTTTLNSEQNLQEKILDRKVRVRTTRSIYRQESLAGNKVIKEIDLAQANHKTIDLDTSADDDTIATTDSSAEDEDEEEEVGALVEGIKLADAVDGTTEQPPSSPTSATPTPTAKTNSSPRPPQPIPATATAATSATSTATSTTSPMYSQLTGTAASDASLLATPRDSFQHHNTESSGPIKAGVIVTASAPRISSRRSSTASAASAFAAATAASHNPIFTQPPASMVSSSGLSRQSVGGGRSQMAPEFVGQLDSAPCSCNAALRRASCTPSQQASFSARGSLAGASPTGMGTACATPTHYPNVPLPPRQVSHHPNCTYFQQQVFPSSTNLQQQQQQQAALAGQQNQQQQQQPVFYANPYSELSSVCNSRASSRLSSCAGLDYSTCNSSVALNTQQQQQVGARSTAQVLGGQQQVVAAATTPAAAPAPAPATASGPNATAPPSGSTSLRGSNAGSIGRVVLPANSKQTSQAAAAQPPGTPTRVAGAKKNSAQINIRSVATIRVLSVIRHWVSKHAQDFANDNKLACMTQEFLSELINDTSLLPAEHKAAIQLQQMVYRASRARNTLSDLDVLLAPPLKPSIENIETLSALEVAEGMTYLDHKIFLAIRSEEFLGQAWMKADKAIKAPHILLITKRFNDVSRLVASEIIRVHDQTRRQHIIEKWTNVAHICRIVHNFNGVLQICAALTNSAVFRLRKTWDKIPKNTKTTIEQLQLLVSTDSRFRNMRDAISRCDPPSIPYVGMYLTDLSFIEEGTPNYSPDGLLNFSKMRMIAHVIREIQHLQNGSYKIPINNRVADYLLDSSRHLQDEEMYRCSLAIEPRASGGRNGVSSAAPSTQPSNAVIPNGHSVSAAGG